MVILLIVATGVYSYWTLPRESAPDVPIPLILVNTPYEGVSPEDIESQITMKIESELSGIKGLKEIRSDSQEGMSAITVEFDPDVVIEDALQRVRDKVDLAKPELPDEAEEPIISELNVAEFPILIVSISGKIAPVRLKAIADQLEDRIELVPGVLEVDVVGTVEREIRLEIDPDRLAAYHLTFADLLSTIPAENVNISVGGLETRGTKFNVRVPAEFVSPSDANQLILTVDNGMPIYLTDVVTIEDTFKDATSISRLNGETNVTLNVKKRIGANIIEIAEHVKAILAEARRHGAVAYVAQRLEAELTFPMSAGHVVRMGALCRLGPFERLSGERQQLVEQAIDVTGIAPVADQPIGTLSGGQVQRVMIARALAAKPRILVLDEPTIGVDPAGQIQFARLLETARDRFGLTIVIVSHDVKAIAAACDRVACLSRTLHSHIAPSGLTPQVLAEVFQHDVAAFFGDVHVDAHTAAECTDPAHQHPADTRGDEPRKGESSADA